MTRFDLVIFDCDGVLIDSEVIAAELHAARLMRLGYRITAEDVIRRFTGVTDRAMYETISREWGRALPADYDSEVKRALAQAYRSELRPIPGVDEAVAAVAGPKCVASSSQPEKLRLGLECTGLYACFAPHVFSAAMVARGKPAPDLFLFAAERMSAAPARCLVIEDSVAGVQAARAAGMTVLGFHGGRHCGPEHPERLTGEGAERVFGDMHRLPALLAELGTRR